MNRVQVVLSGFSVRFVCLSVPTAVQSYVYNVGVVVFHDQVRCQIIQSSCRRRGSGSVE